MVLDKLSVPGRPAYLDYSGANTSVLAIGGGEGCLNIFSLIYHSVCVRQPDTLDQEIRPEYDQCW